MAADNRSVHVYKLAKEPILWCSQRTVVQADVKELRNLAVSALLQLEALKEEVHRLAGATTSDVRTHRMLAHTTALINKMRHGD